MLPGHTARIEIEQPALLNGGSLKPRSEYLRQSCSATSRKKTVIILLFPKVRQPEIGVAVISPGTGTGISLHSANNVPIIAQTVVLQAILYKAFLWQVITMAANEGSYIRWQSIAVNQLGYSLNLILAFAAASLGFTLTLVKDSEVTSSCWGRALLVLSGISFFLSIAFGIWCVLNRLADFRKTAQNARDREMKETTPSPQSENDQKLQQRRTEVKRLGERTWILFYWQVGTFCAGVVGLVGTLIVAYHAILF